MNGRTILLSAILAAAGGYGIALAAEAMPADVHVMHGMLTGMHGMTLYTFAKDTTPNESMCKGNCLKNWPAVKASADAHNMGDWSVISRDDGTKQWAYKGKPLYYFANDKKEGDTVGEGKGNGAWHIAKP
jgi:predicted lipoprotein with Yx(FWY)xxD motif